ncbi:XRE family transcriptional regulator [Kribbella capetownensis]|uniref:XRE family transcriptional regulator n=1 Tax=Kribbella capetownensis TaxID=1572659 RepID=A0A4R0K2F9_9ACTN|nr:helix-turn-helix transcriptional regulator [Kribbella capetownensis]TCC53460.1 XRE family transcriptional regulator [Kribbella capetownensis]
MTNEGLSDFLVRMRRERGLSQGDVARTLGLSQPGYSNIERGNVRLSMKYIPALEEILGLRHAELVDRMLGLTTPVERAVVADQELRTTQAKRLLLLLYGELTGRDSVRVLSLYEGDGNAT